MGVGKASGMFPVDSQTLDYDKSMEEWFNSLIAEKNFPWKLRDILPQVLPAGAEAGVLTEAGANNQGSMQQALLDKHYLRKYGAGAYHGQG